MRKKLHEQLPLMPARIRHDRAAEYAEISGLLDEMPEVLDLVDADLRGEASADTGRPGLSAEQVLRALIVKQTEQFSYDQLAFHLADSSTYGWFCRLGVADDPPSANRWQDNIKKLSAGTLQAVSRALLGIARSTGVEDGSTVRGDCTVVQTDIHHPTDSWLLWDGVRVLTRIMKRAREAGVDLHLSDHTRRAKKRRLAIDNARNADARLRPYRDLLKVARETAGYAGAAIDAMRDWWPEDGDFLKAAAVVALRDDLLRYLPLVRKVIDQTRRRVLHGESVAAADKIVSIFEPHSDIIVKGGRETEFGHKVFLTSGASGLVLDCITLAGNPADTTLVDEFLERHVEVYEQVPAQTAFDGGFTSKRNLQHLKDAGVEDAMFHKKRGLAASDMVESPGAYRTLRAFRAGIEGGISWLKRCFGWTRCRWSGLLSFKAYVWSSVLATNLLVMARSRLA